MVRQCTDEYGTGIEDMVQDFDDARDEDDEMEESAKSFYEMLESSKRPLHAHTELCQIDAIAQVMALKAQFNLGQRMLRCDLDPIWAVSTQRSCYACKPTPIG